jgi:anti-sigma regulatory factor (Ser/Thr protein kinase)
MVRISGNIDREDNQIIVAGPFGGSDFHHLLALIHNIVQKLGYEDVILDFSACSAAFAPAMLAVCSQVMDYRRQRVDFELRLPTKSKTAKLFMNTNWAHYIEPKQYDRSYTFTYPHLPATQFTTTSEQAKAVDKIIVSALGTFPGIVRSDLAVIEWSVSEITDNVLTHSHSAVGGLVQVTAFEKERRELQFVVCDSGVGIPSSLRGTHPEITSDSDAIFQAIQEGVTRDKAFGQGNGLYGSFQVAKQSGGEFSIHSGFAHLYYEDSKGLHAGLQTIPFKGTLVVSGIDFSQQGVLEQALQFGGETHRPSDIIQTKYESTDGAKLVFTLKNEASSLGSRLAARQVRIQISNLLQMSGSKKIAIDFEDIALISSSFADEVFGKLFVEMGPIRFGHRIELINSNDTIQGLIDKAIVQRTATGL